MSAAQRRTLLFTGMLAVGKGVALVMKPDAFAHVWRSPSTPRWYDETVAWMERRPAMGRVAGMLATGLGLVLMRRAMSDEEK